MNFKFWEWFGKRWRIYFGDGSDPVKGRGRLPKLIDHYYKDPGEYVVSLVYDEYPPRTVAVTIRQDRPYTVVTIGIEERPQRKGLWDPPILFKVGEIAYTWDWGDGSDV